MGTQRQAYGLVTTWKLLTHRWEHWKGAVQGGGQNIYCWTSQIFTWLSQNTLMEFQWRCENQKILWSISNLPPSTFIFILTETCSVYLSLKRIFSVTNRNLYRKSELIKLKRIVDVWSSFLTDTSATEIWHPNSGVIWEEGA